MAMHNAQYPNKIRANELHMPTLDITKFHWDKVNNVLTAEASDFGAYRDTFDPHTYYKFIHQIWNDACDIGISIYSPTTDRTERFYLSEIDKDAEGEIQGFNFLPLNPNLKTKVLIIHD